MSRAVARQISFADFELMRQGVRLEPLLQAIADFLDDQKEMIERVRRRSGTRSEEAGERSPWIDAATGPARAGSHARQELGLSRTARTDRRRIDAASVC